MGQGNSGVFGSTIGAHKALMGILWGPAINISIFLVLYAYRRYPFYLHALVGLFATVYTLASTIPIVLTTGILSASTTLGHEISGSTLSAHYIIGIVCMSLILLSAVMGMATRLVNLAGRSSSAILAVRKVHLVTGYLTALLCKINSYVAGEGFAALLIQDLIFLVLIIAWKWRFPKMESRTDQPEPAEVREVQSLKELDQTQDYCIYANQVFSLAPILRDHPAGYQIIEAVKNRSVDCFMLGMLPAELLPSLPTHSHSFKSLALLGDPVAKIKIEPVVQGLEAKPVEMRINSLANISVSGRIYEMHLSAVNQRLEVGRYTHISQLGRFHAITLNGAVTRLYTTVHFLSSANKQFIRSVLPSKTLSSGIKIRAKPDMDTSSEQMEEVKRDGCLPVLFKVYEGGRFTEQLVKDIVGRQPVSLAVSEARGEGLGLGRLQAGRVLIVAGGTGLYPFCDLIDLLFKQQLCEDNPAHKPRILQLSPILRENPFLAFRFQILAAFRQLEDIHPITLQQMLYLAQHSRFCSLAVRLSDPADESQLPGVRLFEEKIQSEVERAMLEEDSVKKVWICGPPKMNEAVGRLLCETFKRADLCVFL